METTKQEKKMKIMVLNGPNLNLLGIREPTIYGNQSYATLERMIRDRAEELGVCIGIENIRPMTKLRSRVMASGWKMLHRTPK